MASCAVDTYRLPDGRDAEPVRTSRNVCPSRLAARNAGRSLITRSLYWRAVWTGCGWLATSTLTGQVYLVILVDLVGCQELVEVNDHEWSKEGVK